MAESISIHQAGLLTWIRTCDALSLALAVEESVARAVLNSARDHAHERMCDVIIDVGCSTADHLVVEIGFVGPKISRGGYQSIKIKRRQEDKPLQFLP